MFTAATTLLVVIGPFNTATELSLTWRAVYWFTLIFGGAAMSFGISNLFIRWTARTNGIQFAVLQALRILTVSVPISVLVIGMEFWLRGEIVLLADWPTLLVYVFAITASITSVSSLLDQRRALREQLGDVERPISDASNPTAVVLQTPFHRRLDPTLRMAQVQMIKAEDHYLRVTTTKGYELIRCSLSTAVSELDGVNGKQVHRSFWVSHDAILGVKRYGNAYRLILGNDVSVPLSRRRYRDLSKAGWLPS